MVYSARRFIFCLACFVLVVFGDFNFAITSLGEEKAGPRVFRAFICFARVNLRLFPLDLGVSDWLQLVIVALPGLFVYLFAHTNPRPQS